MLDFKDVELRIRGAKSGGDGRPSVHDVEVRVDGSGLWIGESTLDVDSLDLVELSQVVEDEFGIELKGEDIKDLKTVGQAIDLVVSRAS